MLDCVVHAVVLSFLGVDAFANLKGEIVVVDPVGEGITTGTVLIVCPARPELHIQRAYAQKRSRT